MPMGRIGARGIAPRAADAKRFVGTHRRRVALFLVALALVLRLGFVAYDSGFKPVKDAADFDREAVSLALHGEYAPSTIAPGGGPSAFRPPAYPYLLAGAYAVTGTSQSTSRFTVARVLSAVLSTAVVALTGLVAGLLWGWGAALVALALSAVYPPLVTVGDAMLAEPLFMALVLAAVAATLVARRSPHPFRWAVAAGLAVGLATLARTNGAILIPVIAVGLWWRPRRMWSSLVPATAGLVAAVLALMPWMVRNTVELGRWVPLTTQAGLTLAGTYNDESLNLRSNPAGWLVPTMPPYGALRREGGNEAQIEQRFRSQALSFATGHPAYVAKVAYYNLGRLLGFQGADFEHVTAAESGIGGRVSDVDVYSFYVLLAIGLAAVLTGATRRTPAFVWAVPLAIVVSLVFVTADMRYRLPIDPFFIVLVAGAAVGSFRRVLVARAHPGARHGLLRWSRAES